MNEANLVAMAKSGETAALDLLLVTNQASLFRTVLRVTRNREDAEDAMQDSLLSAFLHVNSFDGRSTFSTWLTRIGINSALMTLRRNRKYREVSADDTSYYQAVLAHPDLGPNPEQHCAQQERARLLRRAIGDLRASIRRPLELRAFEDYSMKEIAREIGLSLPAAKGRLHHSMTALRKSKSLRSIGDRGRRKRISNAVQPMADVLKR